MGVRATGRWTFWGITKIVLEEVMGSWGTHSSLGGGGQEMPCGQRRQGVVKGRGVNKAALLWANSPGRQGKGCDWSGDPAARRETLCPFSLGQGALGVSTRGQAPVSFLP